MGYISTWMGDRTSELLMSLMTLQLALVDQNPFQPVFIIIILFFLGGGGGVGAGFRR